MINSDHSVQNNLIDEAVNDILLLILPSDNFIKFCRRTSIGTVWSIYSSFKNKANDIHRSINTQAFKLLYGGKIKDWHKKFPRDALLFESLKSGSQYLMQLKEGLELDESSSMQNDKSSYWIIPNDEGHVVSYFIM